MCIETKLNHLCVELVGFEVAFGVRPILTNFGGKKEHVTITRQ